MNLRRKLMLAFTLVALSAVGLTALLTFLAAQRAQNRLMGLFLEHMQSLPSTAFSDMNRQSMLPGHMADMSSFFGEPGQAISEGLQLGTLLAGLTAGLLALVTATVVSRRLSAPYVRLVQGVRRLEAGERGLRVTPTERDELGALTAAFNSLSVALERQEALRRDLVADVAHDLRTPLAVLRSKLEAIQDGLLPLDQPVITVLHNEVLALGHLVEDLRTLSIAEAGGLDLHLEHSPLLPLLERTVAGFTSLADTAGVRLTLHPVDPQLSANIDRQRFGQVLNNLIDNAIRHVGPGTVELHARRVANHIHVMVRDCGPGLAPEALDRVFDRFYRADSARSRRTDGSGLGLSIARALVVAQGGRLEVCNHPDGGAVFTVILAVVSKSHLEPFTTS
jgi:two-component system, OmpR family, sensor histidine kinase BaeS